VECDGRLSDVSSRPDLCIFDSSYFFHYEHDGYKNSSKVPRRHFIICFDPVSRLLLETQKFWSKKKNLNPLLTPKPGRSRSPRSAALGRRPVAGITKQEEKKGYDSAVCNATWENNGCEGAPNNCR